MTTVRLVFPSVEKRDAVHDAVLGYADARDEEQIEELRCLFAVGQAIGELENREPATMENHPMFSDSAPGEISEPLLEATVEFDDEEQFARCQQFFEEAPAEELNWVAEQFADARS